MKGYYRSNAYLSSTFEQGHPCTQRSQLWWKVIKGQKTVKSYLNLEGINQIHIRNTGCYPAM